MMFTTGFVTLNMASEKQLLFEINKCHLYIQCTIFEPELQTLNPRTNLNLTLNLKSLNYMHMNT